MKKGILELDESDAGLKTIFTLGAVTTVIVLAGVIIDLIFGTITGGNLTALPQTAVDRFLQIRDNWTLGLYNLDLLNAINQLILIPSYVALYLALRQTRSGFALLGLIVFLVGSTLLVSGNVALPMYELSIKYAASTLESQKMLYAAAGEALLAKGIHGSMGMFFGFLLPNIAGIIMSYAMITGRIFTKWTGYLGLTGSALMCIYIVLVTFVPDIKSMATLFAAPAGLMLMAWMILFAIRFFRYG